MARKAALRNMPVACCNRRGFSAEKRVHFGMSLSKNKSLHGGLAQLGERLPCKQEVTGSIPVLSTIKEIDWSSNSFEASLSLLGDLRCTLKTEHCELWCNYEKATVKEIIYLKGKRYNF